VFNYGVYLFDNCSCKLQPNHLKELVLANNVALNEQLLLRAWAITLDTRKLFRVDLETGNLTTLADLPQDGRVYRACDFINGTYYVVSDEITSTDGKLQTIDANGAIMFINSLPTPDQAAGNNTVSLQHDLKNNITYYINDTNANNINQLQYTLNSSNGMFALLGSIPLLPDNDYPISLVIDSTGKAYFLTNSKNDATNDKLYDYNLVSRTVSNPRPIVDKNDSAINILFTQESDFSCGSNGKLYGMLRLSNDTTKFGTIEIKPDKAVFTEITSFPYALYAFAIDC